MLFINWDQVGKYAITFLVIAGSLALLRYALGKHKLILIPVALLTTPLFLAAALFAVLITMASGCTTNNPPLYSPDGRAAIRVSDWNPGALGGGTFVRVYQAHGLRSTVVASGGYNFVKPEQIHWLNDTEVHIDHYAFEADPCQNAGPIQVHCTVVPEPQYPAPSQP